MRFECHSWNFLIQFRKPKLDPQALLKSITVNVGSSDETLDIETSEWYTLEGIFQIH